MGQPLLEDPVGLGQFLRQLVGGFFLSGRRRVPVGASAEVEILIETKERALTVPARAVLGTAKQRYVYKVVDGLLVKSMVTVGVGNYEKKEILTGISDKDLVVLPADDNELQNGQKVETETQAWP